MAEIGKVTTQTQTQTQKQHKLKKKITQTQSHHTQPGDMGERQSLVLTIMTGEGKVFAVLAMLVFLT